MEGADNQCQVSCCVCVFKYAGMQDALRQYGQQQVPGQVVGTPATAVPASSTPPPATAPSDSQVSPYSHICPLSLSLYLLLSLSLPVAGVYALMHRCSVSLRLCKSDCAIICAHVLVCAWVLVCLCMGACFCLRASVLMAEGSLGMVLPFW